MQLTFATTYMALLTTGIFLTGLTICLINRNLLVRFGYKLLALFVIFTFLRFLLPVEFPFTKRVALPITISDVIAFLRHRLFYIAGQPVSIWVIFECIWGLGALLGISLFIISYIRTNQYIVLYGRELTHKAPYQELVESICREQHRNNSFRIIELPGLSTPMLFGIFSPKILLPEKIELTKEQAYYILRHEMTHHFHHDLFLKCMVKIITLIYWWNPFCLLLNHQTDVILEMHVDDSLTHSDAQLTSEYMNCLIDYASETTKKAPLSNKFTMGLFPKEDSDLVKRFYLMSHNQTKSDLPLFLGMCFMVLGIYVCSYLFIFEGYASPNNLILEPPSSKELNNLHVIYDATSYFIDNGDGTYDLYCDGLYLETTTSTEDYFPDAPVYTPENNPYKDISK